MTETQQKQKRKSQLSDSFGGTVEKDIPENVEWIDDAFYIKETRFGLYTSILKEPLGQHFITGATKDGVISISRWHLMCLQEGTLDDYTKIINSGVVGANSDAFFGVIAQLVERLLCTQEVWGSSPHNSILNT